MDAPRQRWKLGCLGLALFAGGVLCGCMMGAVGTAALQWLKVPERVQVMTARPTRTPKPTETPTPTETPVPSRCVPASTAQMESIRAGVTGELRSGWAVKSNEFQQVWMVAAMPYGPGMEVGGGSAVWAVAGSPDKPDAVASVNAVAKAISDWPDASKTSVAIDLTTDGVQEAKACAEANR